MNNPVLKEVSLRKMRWNLFLLSRLKIPMLGRLRPRLIRLDREQSVVRIRLKRRSKNHLNSMYFAALAAGADVAGGIHVFYFAEAYGKKVSFAFKSVKGQFLKRAETDVEFVCKEGPAIESFILKSMETKERYNHIVIVNAYNTSGEIVAVFEMEISVKVY